MSASKSAPISFDSFLAKPQTPLKDLLAGAKDKTSQKSGKSGKQTDPRYWYPARNEEGNANCIIRFLPGVGTGAYIKYAQHIWQNPFNERWLYLTCLFKHGNDKCPVCEANNKLWKAEEDHIIDGGKLVVSGIPGRRTTKNSPDKGRKCQNRYVSNILVIKDPMNPENEGKVFLFDYGFSIYDQCVKAAAADEADPEKPVFEPSSFEEGASYNFKVTYDKRKKNVTYEGSRFLTPTKLYEGNVDKWRAVYEAQYDLQEVYNGLEWVTPAEARKKFVYACHPLDIEIGTVSREEYEAVEAEFLGRQAARAEREENEGKSKTAEEPKVEKPANKIDPTKAPVKAAAPAAKTVEKPVAKPAPKVSVPADEDDIDLDALARGEVG
jgi:hypothetical protein